MLGALLQIVLPEALARILGVGAKEADGNALLAACPLDRRILVAGIADQGGKAASQAGRILSSEVMVDP